MGPVVVEIHWYRQLRLVETYDMTFVVMDELSNDMVFLLTVEAFYVEANHYELLHFLHLINFSSRMIELPLLDEEFESWYLPRYC